MLFAPELLADGRRRFEQTGEPLYLIAADFGIHRSTFSAFATRKGWVRHRPAPREMSASSRLLKQTERLEAEAMALWHAPVHDAVATGAPPANAGDMTASIDWLHREVRAQIAAVETLRARMRATPQTAQEAAVVSRTLVALTGALQKLQRMACGPSQAGQIHDDISDIPADIDAFREALAQRIEKFLANRTDADAYMDADAAGDAASE
jgi:hypothetical protein